MLENDRGEPIDPVPFLVVTALGALACYSLGPGYLLALGAELTDALAASTLAALVTTAVAYHRFVRTRRPEHRAEIPAGARLRRLLVGSLAVAGVFVLLLLPLLALG